MVGELFDDDCGVDGVNCCWCFVVVDFDEFVVFEVFEDVVDVVFGYVGVLGEFVCFGFVLF